VDWETRDAGQTWCGGAAYGYRKPCGTVAERVLELAKLADGEVRMTQIRKMTVKGYKST
jgi:hypothetical protein